MPGGVARLRLGGVVVRYSVGYGTVAHLNRNCIYFKPFRSLFQYTVPRRGSNNIKAIPPLQPKHIASPAKVPSDFSPKT